MEKISSSYNQAVGMGQFNQPLNETKYRENARKRVAKKEPPSLKTSVKKFTKIDGNPTSYSMNGIKANARLRVEQDADLVIKNMNLKILGQAQDDVLITRNPQYKLYKANEELKNLRDGLLFRKCFGETGNINFFQILNRKQLVNEVLLGLHGEFGTHQGITKTIIAYRENISSQKSAIDQGVGYVI